MEFAAQAQAQLLPLINRVLALAEGDNTAADPQAAVKPGGADLPLCAFFTGIRIQAQAMQAEEDVLALFFELSATAFLGFEYSGDVAKAIDELLATAEQIAFAMTASDERPH
jgi:hypothetical protein